MLLLGILLFHLGAAGGYAQVPSEPAGGGDESGEPGQKMAVGGCGQSRPQVAGREGEEALAPAAEIVNDKSSLAAIYNVGAARTDITGPFVQSSTGYNSPGDEMSGLAMRLYSRTFVIEQPNRGVMAIVTADQLQLFQSIKLGVVKRLAADGYGDVFTTDNLLIAATHTHAATSNTSWYTLYNLFTGVTGFDALHYEVVVRGIAESIERAYDTRQPATIKLAIGASNDVTYNRSAPAYQENKDAGDYATDTDAQMTLLRFDALDGAPLGLLNWLGVHGTSVSIANRRVHGDAKGYASYEVERIMGDGFVAAFAQSTTGDVSPNQPQAVDRALPFLRPSDIDPSLDPQEDPIVAGWRQLHTALVLYANAEPIVAPDLEWRHTHVNFNAVAVDPESVGDYWMPWDAEVVEGTPSTCVGVIGAGFLAGDEEGAPVAFAAEGDIRNTYVRKNGGWEQRRYDFNQLDGDGIAALLGPLWPVVSAVLATDQHDACHKEKRVLLPVGDVRDFYAPNPEVPFVPVVIPLQIMRIGRLAVLASPFEVTTMAGRRLKERVYRTLAPAGIDRLVVAGYANSFNLYLTTREEYAAQHFEGAFNLFGPWSDAAVYQELDRIATDLAAGSASEPGPEPPNLAGQQHVETWISSSGVVTDGGDFGAVLEDVEATYSRASATVRVRFRGAHPRTILVKKMDGSLGAFYSADDYTFMEVQRKTGDTWSTVATDTDPYTAFDWRREGGSNSLSDQSIATATWLVREQPAGAYRILYHGLAKRLLGFVHTYEKFTGTSATFVLE
jgi:neutral ceramidase